MKIHDDFIVKNDPLYAQNNGETLPASAKGDDD